jgi:hypothetical protein
MELDLDWQFKFPKRLIQGRGAANYRGNQMRSKRRSVFPLVIFSLMFLVISVSSGEVRADPIAVTGGHYTLVSPFVIPRFISYGFDLQTAGFRATGGEGDGPSHPSGSNCGFPCLPGATFNLDAIDRVDTPDVLAILNVGGVNYTGRFEGALHFVTQSFTIPLDPGEELTLSAPFEMSGSLSFHEIDGPFSFSSDVVGAGSANVSLFLSPLAHDYEIRRIDYNFQAAPVPEPATLILLSSGLVAIAARRYRRRQGGDGLLAGGDKLDS